MNDLMIRLTGQITASNFESWKKELIGRIRNVKTELVQDEDFFEAAGQVKYFKQAEVALKQAKESAIEQAAEIQRLFTAIDEISAEARDMRLTLERQIKVRKEEIKRELIDEAVQRTKALLAEHSVDVQSVNHDLLLNRARYEAAIKGRSGRNGVELALNQEHQRIGLEIDRMAQRIARQAKAIDALPEKHQLLLQDRGYLLGLEPQAMETELQRRIAQFESARERIADEGAGQTEVLSIEPAPAKTAVQPVAKGTEGLFGEPEPQRENFRIVISLTSTQVEAAALSRTLRDTCASMVQKFEIKLTRVKQ
jgi:hypothetical protein